MWCTVLSELTFDLWLVLCADGWEVNSGSWRLDSGPWGRFFACSANNNQPNCLLLSFTFTVLENKTLWKAIIRRLPSFSLL